MVMLTGRKKADVTVSWILQPTAEVLVGERGIES
jgi:hypothetical protein